MECSNQVLMEASVDVTDTTDICADASNAVNGTHSQSASSSDGVTHSTHSSLAHLTSKERLRRLRAVEELKQKERYAAFVEAQKQADQARLRVQEERKRKIEEVRQRVETRRSLVTERRKEIEQSNKVRLDSLRERSRQRSVNENAGSGSLKARSGRTASVSPSPGSARNPNNLMTTSCVVAFGSSAPRSICTQPSPAALRLKKAFEARLASYLTGRHSGCFLTASSSPNYMHLLDPKQLPPSCFPSSQKTKRIKRPHSMHAPLTESSVYPTASQSQPFPSVSKDACKHGTADSLENADSPDSHRPNHPSESDAQQQRQSRKPREVPYASTRRPIAHESATRTLRSGTGLNRKTATTEARSGSAEALDKRKASASVSVFERLASSTKSRTGSVSDTSAKPPSDPSKPHASTISASKKRPGFPGQGMSMSVYNERTNPRKPLTFSSTHRNASSKLNNPPPQALKENSTDPSSTPPDSAESESSPVNEETLPPPPVHIDAPTDVKVEQTSNGHESDLPQSVTLSSNGPIKAETLGAGEGAVLNESEAVIYRAKLVEQRRLAKERKEEEQRRLEEENRQRRMKQEHERLAAEEAARELAVAMAAREAEEADRVKRQREEEDKARFAAAEAERLSKMQQAEEERLLRKKKLDSIMSRVKSSHLKAHSTVQHSSSTPAFDAPSNQDVPKQIPIPEPLPSVPDSTEAPANQLSVNDAGDDAVHFTIEDAPSNANTCLLGTDSVSIEMDSVEEVEKTPNFDENSGNVEYITVPVVDGGGDDISAGSSNNPETTEILSVMHNGSSDHADVFNPSEQRTEHTPPWDAQGDTLTSDAIPPDTNFLQPDSTNFPHDSLKQTDHPFTEVLTPVDQIASTNGIGASEAPRFKSALLQSMLSGGRLVTSTKDAVSDMQYS